MKWPVIGHLCGASREYFYGDKRPPRELGYMEFVAWSEAQRLKRKPKKKAKR